MMSARAPLLRCACRLTTGMVGPVPVRTHLPSFDRTSHVSAFVAGSENGDVRIQKLGILLQERGFLFQSGQGGAHHV